MTLPVTVSVPSIWVPPLAFVNQPSKFQPLRLAVGSGVPIASPLSTVRLASETLSPPFFSNVTVYVIAPVARLQFRVRLSPAPLPYDPTAMRYVVPSTALNEILLVMMPPSGSLSFSATVASDATALPVYAPITVSGLEPFVSNVAVPFAGAVHFHHTVVSLLNPARCSGSPVSKVAFTLLPATLPEAPEIVVALANMSFAGAGGVSSAQWAKYVMSPVTVSVPSIWVPPLAFVNQPSKFQPLRLAVGSGVPIASPLSTTRLASETLSPPFLSNVTVYWVTDLSFQRT